MSLDSLCVLCTGNPNNPGITRQVSLAFPNTVCLHKSMGVDLLTSEGLDYLDPRSKNVMYL